MKKQSLLLVARVFCLVFVFVAPLFKVVNASAASSDTSLDAPRFSYSGTKQDFVLFKVNFLNAEGKKFVFEVKDESGEILYTQTFNSKNFDKTVCVPRGRDRTVVNFAIKSGGTLHKQSFEINPQVRLVEDYVVTKL